MVGVAELFCGIVACLLNMRCGDLSQHFGRLSVISKRISSELYFFSILLLTGSGLMIFVVPY